MIRKTLSNTKLASFAIAGPSKDNPIVNIPYGTGFFISDSGYFITAAHVIFDPEISNTPRFDHTKIILIRDIHDEQKVGNSTCCTGAVIHVDFINDVAILKVSDHETKDESWIINGKFPFLQISARTLDEAEPVYSYGYPLSETVLINTGQTINITIQGHGTQVLPVQTYQTHLSPRITSLIVSSRTENSNIHQDGSKPNSYVLDKALNYGNSGGPIICVETGYVHGMCRRFQPVAIKQHSIKDNNQNPINIIIPSLYGIATNLSIDPIKSVLINLGIPIDEDQNI